MYISYTLRLEKKLRIHLYKHINNKLYNDSIEYVFLLYKVQIILFTI